MTGTWRVLTQRREPRSMGGHWYVSLEFLCIRGQLRGLSSSMPLHRIRIIRVLPPPRLSGWCCLSISGYPDKVDGATPDDEAGHAAKVAEDDGPG